jgi:hypothetical protein
MRAARASCRIADEALQEGRRGEIARIGRHPLDDRRDQQRPKAERSDGSPDKHDCSHRGESTVSHAMARRTPSIFGKPGPDFSGIFPQKT